MEQRYWEASMDDIQEADALLDWVDKNVKDAVRDSWENASECGDFALSDKALLFRVLGANDPDDKAKCFTFVFDMCEEIDKLEDYETSFLAKGLRSLAEKILALPAVKALEEQNEQS